MRLSCRAATSVSKKTAVVPPTKIDSSILFTASRIAGIRSRDSRESGAVESVTFRIERPFFTITPPALTSGATSETPATPRNLSVTAGINSFFKITLVGSPSPPGK